MRWFDLAVGAAAGLIAYRMAIETSCDEDLHFDDEDGQPELPTEAEEKERRESQRAARQHYNKHRRKAIQNEGRETQRGKKKLEVEERVFNHPDWPGLIPSWIWRFKDSLENNGTDYPDWLVDAYWAAEVLNVPPGALIRHDKDEDEGTAAARVTRAAGSRPSSEEMLRRGYMLRKGDTLACKMLILTDGEMRKGMGGLTDSIRQLDEWSRQNHIAYATERGYCLIRTMCVASLETLTARKGSEGDDQAEEMGSPLDRGKGASVGEVECGPQNSLHIYSVMMQLFRQAIEIPQVSYMALVDRGVFFTNFARKFEDVVTETESQMRSRAYIARHFPPQEVMNDYCLEDGRPIALSSSMNAASRLSIVIAADGASCGDKKLVNAGLSIWRGSLRTEKLILELLAKAREQPQDDADELLTQHVFIHTDLERIRCFCRFARRLEFRDALAVPSLAIEWSLDGSMAVVTPRTINSFRKSNRTSVEGTHAWRAGDFVAHLSGVSASNGLQILPDACNQAAAVTRHNVCPWL